MKIFKLITLIIGFILFASGCSNDSSSSNTEVERVYVNACVDDNEDSFTQIETGDILKNEEEGTTIKILYNENDSKFVCTLTGKAYIMR